MWAISIGNSLGLVDFAVYAGELSKLFFNLGIGHGAENIK